MFIKEIRLLGENFIVIDFKHMQIYNKYNTFGQNKKNQIQNLNNNEADIKLKYPFHCGKNILLDLPIAFQHIQV